MPAEKKKHTKTSNRAFLRLICQALDDHKAEDLMVLDVSEQSSITDYLVLATGNSEPHLRALRSEIDRVVKETGTRILGFDGGEGSGWNVVDAFDVMVHVLTPENRARYQLESLWGDAPKVSVARLLAAPKPRKKAAKKKQG